MERQNCDRVDLIRFDQFELDTRTGLLSRDGRPVKLSRQPSRALVYLAQRAGRVVSRAELQKAVWLEGTNVDFEHGLNTCIRQVRSALGDSASDPRIIATVHKVGFRFIAPVHTSPAVVPPGQEVARVRGAGRMPRATLTLASALAFVVSSLLVTLALGRAPHPDWPTRNSEAFDLWVRGRIGIEQRWTLRGGSAVELFERAVQLDPQFAAAYAGIADAHWQEVFRGAASSAVVYPKARAAVERALQLNPRLADAHLALATLKTNFERDVVGAEKAYRRALELDPREVRALDAFAIWLSLQGRFDEALGHVAEAKRRAPEVARVRYAESVVLHYSRQFDECLRAVAETLERDPAYLPAYHIRGLCHRGRGEYDLALTAFEQSGRRSGNYGETLARAGRRAEADALREELIRERGGRPRGSLAQEIAQITIGLGANEEAITWLEQTLADGGFLGTLKVAPIYDPLREHPRFKALLAKIDGS